PTPTLFPYTTLFRSNQILAGSSAGAGYTGSAARRRRFAKRSAQLDIGVTHRLHKRVHLVGRLDPGCVFNTTAHVYSKWPQTTNAVTDIGVRQPPGQDHGAGIIRIAHGAEQR